MDEKGDGANLATSVKPVASKRLWWWPSNSSAAEKSQSLAFVIFLFLGIAFTFFIFRGDGKIVSNFAALPAIFVWYMAIGGWMQILLYILLFWFVAAKVKLSPWLAGLLSALIVFVGVTLLFYAG